MLDIENNFEWLSEPWALPSIANSYSESEDLKSLKIALVKQICTIKVVHIELSQQDSNIIATITDGDNTYKLNISNISINKIKESLGENCFDKSLTDEEAFCLLMVCIGDPLETFTVLVDLSRLTQQRYFAVEAVKVRLEAELEYLRSKYSGLLDVVSSSPLKKAIASQFLAYDRYGFFDEFKDLYNNLPSALSNSVAQSGSNETRENYLGALALLICSEIALRVFSKKDLEKIYVVTKNGTYILPNLVCAAAKPIKDSKLRNLGSTGNYVLRGQLCNLYNMWKSVAPDSASTSVKAFKQLYEIVFQELEARFCNNTNLESVDSGIPEIAECEKRLNELSDLLLADLSTETVKLVRKNINTDGSLSSLSLASISSNNGVSNSDQEMSDIKEIDFPLSELKDNLADKVALIPYLFDSDGKTFAICECKWTDFRKDPENTDPWQQVDGMLYQRYDSEPVIQFRPRSYSLIKSQTPVEDKGGELFATPGFYASLVRPIRCKFCKRIMLPSSGFLITLSSIAQNKSKTAIPSLNWQYTAGAVETILKSAQERFGEKFGQGMYLWPSAGIQGDQMKIDTSNLFEGSYYENYKSYLSSLEAELTPNSSVEMSSDKRAKLIEFIEPIIMSNAANSTKLGYTYTDFVCSLISSKDDQNYSLAKLVLCCKALYALLLNKAYIDQALAVIDCGYYNDWYKSNESEIRIDYTTAATLWEYITGLTDVFLDAYIIPEGIQTDFEAFRYLWDRVSCSGVEQPISEKEIDSIAELINSLHIDQGKDILRTSLTNLQAIFGDIIKCVSDERDAFIHAISDVDCDELVNTMKYIDTLKEPVNFDDLKYLNRTATLAQLHDLNQDSYEKLLKQTSAKAITALQPKDEDKGAQNLATPFTNMMRTERDHFVQATIYTEEDMQYRFHSIALDAVDSCNYPVLGSLHVDISKVKEPYDELLGRYMSAFSSESSDDILIDELEDNAESAIHLYCLCAIDDSISRTNREVLKKYWENCN